MAIALLYINVYLQEVQVHICRIYLNLWAIHNCQSHENFVFPDQTASRESSHGLIFRLLFFLFNGFGCVCLGKLNEKTLCYNDNICKVSLLCGWKYDPLGYLNG